MIKTHQNKQKERKSEVFLNKIQNSESKGDQNLES